MQPKPMSYLEARDFASYLQALRSQDAIDLYNHIFWNNLGNALVETPATINGSALRSDMDIHVHVHLDGHIQQQLDRIEQHTISIEHKIDQVLRRVEPPVKETLVFGPAQEQPSPSSTR